MTPLSPENEIGTLGTSREQIEVPPFVDGKVIHTTDHFAIVYGYKRGQEGTVEGERTFLVPKSKGAERVMLSFADLNGNAVERRNFGSDNTQTIRYRGNVAELLSRMVGDGISAGIFGSGVPSIASLESRISTKK